MVSFVVVQDFGVEGQPSAARVAQALDGRPPRTDGALLPKIAKGGVLLPELGPQRLKVLVIVAG
ncbi:hypothetical protein R6Y94_25095 [Plantactinospora sp. KLBMP9567]|nr:hypothetical protein [Plantactinospora sp. KLBMP9567]MDW5327100.1 hypothetical protein [Plantactinospora sp. KLBMP9567]